MFSSEMDTANEYANLLDTLSNQLDMILITIIIVSSVLILLTILVIILLFKISRNTKYTYLSTDNISYNGQFPNAAAFQQQTQYGQPYQYQQQANQQGTYH